MKKNLLNIDVKKNEKRSSQGSERSLARGAQGHTNQQDKIQTIRRKTKKKNRDAC